jgi:hypothetical protein
MVWLTVGAPAQAQEAISNAMHTVRQPYNIETFGAFRMLILAGDFSPKVDLAGVLAKRPTTGVGAVADARGEITIYDGKLIVSYGKEASDPAAGTERAALLTVGTVASWQSVSVEHDVAPDNIEVFLAHMAGSIQKDRSPFKSVARCCRMRCT